MSTEDRNELKILVERAVRPVCAGLARKRRMREELLSHLACIFEEELESLGDEQAALRRAAERFGDAQELSRQIQETVPAWRRFPRVLERLRLEPGESLLHFAGKVVLLTLALNAIVILALFPLLSMTGRASEIGGAFRTLLILATASSAFNFAMTVFADRLARVVYGNAVERSLRKAGLYSLASVFLLPLLAFTVYWSLPIDGSTRIFYLWLSCFLAPAMPMFFLLVARQQAEAIRYEDDWASLEIADPAEGGGCRFLDGRETNG